MDRTHIFKNVCKKTYENSTNLLGTLNFTEVILISEHHGKNSEERNKFSHNSISTTRVPPMCLAKHYVLAFDSDFTTTLHCYFQSLQFCVFISLHAGEQLS